MSILFEPIKIGNFEIKNRFIRSATFSAICDNNGFVTDKGIELKKMLADSDIGLIISGYSYVLKNGKRGNNMNGIDTDDHIPGCQEMTRAVHERDGRIVMQLAHCGVIFDNLKGRDTEFLAVSIVDSLPDFRKTARVMNEEDIQTIIKAFGQSARRAQEAGFDGIQLHAAHGYLFTQFLTPRLNERTDQWGGPLKNRMRFLIEVIREIKKCVNDDFPVMVKLGVHDYLDFGVGLTLDEGVEIAAAVEKEGVCFIEISNGKHDRRYEKEHVFKVTTPDEEAYLIKDAKAVRLLTTVPLSLVGGMRSFSVMEKMVANNIVDCVSMCRPLIREPGLIKRWKNGDYRKSACISCNQCVHVDTSQNYHVYCAQT